MPDFEHLFLLLVLFLFFLTGLKKRIGAGNNSDSVWDLFIIDKSTSIAIKGVACFFVLMGHYGTWLINTGEHCGMMTKVITHTTANIALAWFMFFSGYGLSLKNVRERDPLYIWIKRLKKIYLPLFFVCICTTILYMVIPSRGGHFPNQLDCGNVGLLLYRLLGLDDWYVVCIIYFVTLFYLAVFISYKTRWNMSMVLGALLLCYIAIAYVVYGQPEAHFFRYPWAFMFGHLVAVHEKNDKWLNTTLSFLFFLTWVLLDKICIASCIIAILLLFVFGLINKKYVFKGKTLLFLGGISYFFYLSHIRVGWALMVYSGVEYKSVVLWVLITLLCSFFLDMSYKSLSKMLKL